MSAILSREARAARRRARVRRRLAIAARKRKLAQGAVVSATALLLLTSCGAVGQALEDSVSDQANMPKIEKDLAKGIKKQTSIKVSVECPTERVWKVGKSFKCVVISDATDERAMAIVTMEKDGEYVWNIQ